MNGNSLWISEGLALCSDDYEQYDAQIDYENGFYYTGWSDYNGDFMFPEFNIRGQKVDVSGNLLWGDEGILISELEGENKLEDIVGRYYIWRNDSWPVFQIYTQLLNEDGTVENGWPEEGVIISDGVGTYQNL